VGGTADLQTTGTITTLEVMGSGNATFANSDAARTVTTIKLHKGAKLNIACSNLTITNAIQLINCRLDEVTITTNKHVTVRPRVRGGFYS
jgi:pectate lyase